MKIPEFRPADDRTYPKVQDKEIFEVLSPVQRAVKDLVRMTQKRVQTDNLNEDVLQIDLVPDTWTDVEVTSLVGPVRGGCLLLADYSSGYVSGWGFRIVDETQIKVRVRLTADSGSLPATVTTRWLVKGN